jgi:uncharacterized protein YueI
MTKNQPMQPITEKELKDAINSINRRKSADYYNITIDHFLYSEDQIIYLKGPLVYHFQSIYCKIAVFPSVLF